MSDTAPVEPLVLCPTCKAEMRLFGVEPESDIRDLFTFECVECGGLEVRGVLVAASFSPQST